MLVLSGAGSISGNEEGNWWLQIYKNNCYYNMMIIILTPPLFLQLMVDPLILIVCSVILYLMTKNHPKLCGNYYIYYFL